MSGGLSVPHHVIIQALLSRGPLKEKDLHSMFEDLTKKNPGTDRRLFDAFILAMNKALTFANFELRGCIDQYDGQVYYGIVNTVSDEQSKLGTKYTVPQIAFYKAIIEAIVQDATADGFISSIGALNLNLESQFTLVTDSESQGSQPHVPHALKNFGLTQKQNTLRELARDLWLDMPADGNVRLGVKSFLDLRSWFRSNDVPSCHVCNEAGIKGGIENLKTNNHQFFLPLQGTDGKFAELCKNENCTVRIHHYCLKQIFSQIKAAKACPSCGTSWPFAVPKAEAVETEDDTGPRQSQRATGSKGKRRRANTIVEDDGVGCSNQHELNGPTESQHDNGRAQTRTRSRSTLEADTVGPDASQSSSGVSDLRRITRKYSGRT